MNKDLACVALLSIIGFAGSLGIVLAAEIEVQRDVISIEALALSRPLAASVRTFLTDANGERHIKDDEGLLSGI